MAYFQNKQSAWFKRMSEARLFLEEQEENSLQSENIQRPGTKWVFEANLLVEVKIIEDLQAPLHIGAGRLPDWFRYKRCLLALDKYADELCIFRCIAVHQRVHRVPNTIACEQALLFGQAKRASRERASEGPREGELATISHKFSFPPGNPGTPQSVKIITANVRQIRKVTTACQVTQPKLNPYLLRPCRNAVL